LSISLSGLSEVRFLNHYTNKYLTSLPAELLDNDDDEGFNDDNDLLLIHNLFWVLKVQLDGKSHTAKTKDKDIRQCLGQLHSVVGSIVAQFGTCIQIIRLLFASHYEKGLYFGNQASASSNLPIVQSCTMQDDVRASMSVEDIITNIESQLKGLLTKAEQLESLRSRLFTRSIPQLIFVSSKCPASTYMF